MILEKKNRCAARIFSGKVFGASSRSLLLRFEQAAGDAGPSPNYGKFARTDARERPPLLLQQNFFSLFLVVVFKLNKIHLYLSRSWFGSSLKTKFSRTKILTSLPPERFQKRRKSRFEFAPRTARFARQARRKAKRWGFRCE